MREKNDKKFFLARNFFLYLFLVPFPMTYKLINAYKKIVFNFN